MLYSIKMHARKGGKNGRGGRHISGAERIVKPENIEQEVIRVLRRARQHERGAADFIQIKVACVEPSQIQYCPLLPVRQQDVKTVAEGRRQARLALLRAGVSVAAAAKGFSYLTALRDSMRGAMLVDAVSGERVDGKGERGVRCSTMDCADAAAYARALAHTPYTGLHAREAFVLAAKVAAAPGTVAELCWSDDPQYVTGYVASPRYGYERIMVMKQAGDPVGGRVIFIRPTTDVETYMAYLQYQPVLVTCHEPL